MRENPHASQSETRRARVHRRAAPAVPAWQPEIGLPKPAARTNARANKTTTPRLPKLQTARVQLEKHRTRRQAGLPEAQRLVSLPSRHLAETQAIPNRPRGLSGTPGECNREWHRGAESEATDPLERPRHA